MCISKMLIGTDIESVKRFEVLLSKKQSILKKFFTQTEYQYAMVKAYPAQTLTGIWCAKEAVVKALSSEELLDIRDVHVYHLSNGSPSVKPLLGYQIQISISHTQTHATAVAIGYKLYRL